MNRFSLSRVDADSGPVLLVTISATIAVAAASFALSFASLRDAAVWGRVPHNLAWLVPVVIDASVLVYGLVALVLRARGQSSIWAWTLMCAFTGISVVANAAHAYGVSPAVQSLIGAVLVALAPISVLTSTHALASLTVADHSPTSTPVKPEPAPESVPLSIPKPDPVATPVPTTETAQTVAVVSRPRLGRIASVSKEMTS